MIPSSRRSRGPSYEITPYAGVGPVRFGMSREAVRQAVGLPVQEYRQFEWDELTTDFFPEVGVRVSYRHPDLCATVEFVMLHLLSPTFQGRSFRRKAFRRLRLWFAELDPAVVVDQTGLISYALGIGLFSDSALTEPGRSIQSVTVFERGHYDEYLAIKRDGDLAWSIFSVTTVHGVVNAQGMLTLGMTEEEVRVVLGPESRTLSPSDGQGFTHVFPSLGLHVHYTPTRQCAALEFRGPAYPTFGPRRLLAKPYSEIRRWLTALDPTGAAAEDGARFQRLGIGIYPSNRPEMVEAVVRAVTLFPKEQAP